ncbi:hypothetical protein RJ55_03184 [Drechmeria coniospora]|nr:hypothetical protein RJ55_03184 [Drechmeria coniospora]
MDGGIVLSIVVVFVVTGRRRGTAAPAVERIRTATWHHLRHHQTRHNHHHHHYPPSHDPSPTTTNTNTNTTTNASPSLSSVSPRPMEALVRNLGKQTLWSGEEEGGAASDERQDGTPEHSRMAIDVDSDPDPADARHLLPVPRSVEMMRLRRMHSRREPSRPTRVRHAGRRPHPPPAVRRETMRPSVDHVTEALPTPSHNQPPIEVDPMEDPTFPGLEPDEGFGDGPDNVSWLSDGRILVDSQSDVLGGNGILHFRSSAETALQCSVVVQKHARMRRRRQRKRETASRASSVMPTDDGT